ncbi:ABC transporter substrate-binding protein [Tessaracoccus sp. Y1736]
MAHRSTRLSRRTAAAVGLVTACGLLTGCASTDYADDTVTIGYFANVTHAPALIADGAGLFDARLAEAGATASTQSFRAGPEALQAVLAGSVDVAYLGPNPTVTAYLQSRGEAVRVIAGSTSGGASLVVRPGIESPEDLRGKRLATPQLGNTQDIALRHWLGTQGLTATDDGGGDVSVLPQPNSAAVQAFTAGGIDGGWLPEPFATRLVEAGGVVLVDERDLWPDGLFASTTVIANPRFVEERPDLLRAFLDAHLDALALIDEDPVAARDAAASQITALTGQVMDPGTLRASWETLEFTVEPLADTLRAAAAHADAVGLLPDKPNDDFARLWDLAVLNEALDARGLAEVAS